eukprot:11349018-Ditylum_brightwellii.AAC.1
MAALIPISHPLLPQRIWLHYKLTNSGFDAFKQYPISNSAGCISNFTCNCKQIIINTSPKSSCLSVLTQRGYMPEVQAVSPPPLSAHLDD